WTMKRSRKLQPVAINPLVVDLSHHNDVADFGKVKAAGIAGIIHKATEATGFVDNRYPTAKIAFALPMISRWATTLSQSRFISRMQKTPRRDRFCLELARFRLGAGFCSRIEIQGTRGTLSRTDPTPRGEFQTWILDFSAAKKKEQNGIQPPSEAKP